MTARARFTQSDIKRAMAGAIAAGVTAPKIEIDPTGKIIIIADPKNRKAKDEEWADLD